MRCSGGRLRARACGLLVLACGLLTACGGSSPGPTATRTAPGRTAAGTAARRRVVAGRARGRPSLKVATTPETPTRTAPPPPSPGSLPQTSVLPSARTATFQAEMAALWRGIETDSVSAAMPAFFPEGAYLQVKQIADPQTDYVDRLVHDYALDIGAAHQLLGADAATARLVAVRVPSSYVHWVPPGACYNGIGYYEVPNSRIVYRENGRISSFGIASMISWRGVWYVVHLGAVLRTTDAGVVDDPSGGAGYSAPSSTC